MPAWLARLLAATRWPLTLLTRDPNQLRARNRLLLLLSPMGDGLRALSQPGSPPGLLRTERRSGDRQMS